MQTATAYCKACERHARRQRRRNELHAKRSAKQRPDEDGVYTPFPTGPWHLPFQVLVTAFQSPNKHPGRKA